MTNDKEKEQVEEAYQGASKDALRSIDFPTFILSLASSAQIHLGIVPNPSTGKKEKNNDLARQTIDVISLLEEKTKGNLNKDEEKFLSEILYNLRMIFVEATKSSS
ncbi:MAG: DUF1844 domain-containing protein [Deltaproteobacteria bacterium CG_4_10_14_0_2_um_filter_43_8]|nr:MAG: hypothetical protein COV43_01375 [Deltaproteobacteria bacterium CG11_big_fil_rev_8_21_14_0_20_42_23]PJA22101.1 MAG: DUF1844 domain-containing protein [Deltaproteobacteria bacterium CG_4_10_14_0_2_um_filter_43_8]PJC63467.1 MAG: DUF1844 domain-containing protein [Deltaproteobacteria bacterium CG_4_9_14_0_2_um_filter_42_21]